MAATTSINYQLIEDLLKTSEDGEKIFQSLGTCFERLSFANMRVQDISQVTQECIAPNFEKWRLWEEDQEDFRRTLRLIRMLTAEAIHHLHSAFDPLACATYWFNVCRDKRKISDRKLNFYKVQTCESVPAKYRKLFANLANSNSFYHLAALSNLAKHSQIVQPMFSIRSDGVAPASAEHAMVFESCKGQNWLNKDRELPTEIHFPRTPISIFLRAELQRITPLFHELAGLIRSDLDMRLKAEKL